MGILGEPCRKILADTHGEMGHQRVVAGERTLRPSPRNAHVRFLPFLLDGLGYKRVFGYVCALVDAIYPRVFV